MKKHLFGSYFMKTLRTLSSLVLTCFVLSSCYSGETWRTTSRQSAGMAPSPFSYKGSRSTGLWCRYLGLGVVGSNSSIRRQPPQQLEVYKFFVFSHRQYSPGAQAQQSLCEFACPLCKTGLWGSQSQLLSFFFVGSFSHSQPVSDFPIYLDN